MARGARQKGLRPGALASAIEAHATAPSPLALGDSELAIVQGRFSARGYAGLDDEALDIAVLHLWDVGACWGEWPEWAEKRFPHLVRAGFLAVQRLTQGLETVLTTKGVEAICDAAGRAIDAAPSKPCACVICAAAKLGRTIPMQLERGGR
ncbi:MAG: hypothetical protein KJZ75_11405 [Hyphomonadaceae bacterium]|nr:hypothetical protein [Hyphomonadaceae bacterium]